MDFLSVQFFTADAARYRFANEQCGVDHSRIRRESLS
jgi:hypothetical protein